LRQLSLGFYHILLIKCLQFRMPGRRYVVNQSGDISWSQWLDLVQNHLCILVMR